MCIELDIWGLCIGAPVLSVGVTVPGPSLGASLSCLVIGLRTAILFLELLAVLPYYALLYVLYLTPGYCYRLPLYPTPGLFRPIGASQPVFGRATD